MRSSKGKLLEACTLFDRGKPICPRGGRLSQERSPAAANRLLENIKLLTKNLATFPTLGHMSDETLMPKAHRFVIGEYLVDYEVLEREVFVFAIRHGRQRPPEQTFDTDDDYEVI